MTSSLWLTAAVFSILAVSVGAPLTERQSEQPMQTSEDREMASTRYERGLKQLERVDGRAGRRVIERLAEISPDLARYTVEYPFGDVYARSGLGLREREIATIAALTAMGNARPQLKVHVAAEINVGLTRREIEEIIIQMSVYAGFPAALNAMTAADEVFRELDQKEVAPNPNDR